MPLGEPFAPTEPEWLIRSQAGLPPIKKTSELPRIIPPLPTGDTKDLKVWQEYWKQHDAQVAKAAREQVLDTIIAWKRKHGYWFTVNAISGEKRYHFEPDRFEEFIKELRHNAPQSEQEQPR